MTRTFEDALLDAVQRVKKAETEYAISGGVAKGLYGAPAFTKDLDVLAKGARLLEHTLRPQFSLIATGPGAEAYEDVSGFVVEVFDARSELEHEMLSRAEERALGEERVKVLHPTDWAAMKLREARISPVEAGRHLADVRTVHGLHRWTAPGWPRWRRPSAPRPSSAPSECAGPRNERRGSGLTGAARRRLMQGVTETAPPPAPAPRWARCARARSGRAA